MKKLVFGICIIAFGSIAFGAIHPVLNFLPPQLDATNVTDPESYNNIPMPDCSGGDKTPCKLDINGYADEAAFLAYLSTLSEDDAILEVKMRAISFKN